MFYLEVEIIKLCKNVLKTTHWYLGTFVSLGGFDVKDYGRVFLAWCAHGMVQCGIFLGTIAWHYHSMV